MILHRKGNKTKIADKIYPLFPEHHTYIELFFGAGGMFFNKPISKYNICNDIDDDIFNFWLEVKYNKENLLAEIMKLPFHSSLWAAFKDKNFMPVDNTLKAALFFMYSNKGFYSEKDTMKISATSNTKSILNKKIDLTFEKIKNVTFLNYDFREVLSKISFISEDKNKIFIYSDPSYLDTHGYGYSWKKEDVIDCFDVTFNSGIKGAMSEFDNEFIISEAEKRNLNIHIIGKRKNIKNIRKEILITNYATVNYYLFS